MTTFPPQFRRIRLNLARSKEFPSGSAKHGYEILAPLAANHHIDAEAWKAHRGLCRVTRFWAGEPDELGWLIHRSGGEGGAHWVIDYDPNNRSEDEAAYRFGAHAFSVGEYVSIADEDGELHTFQVAAVDPPH